jgi:hypothetical protein
MYGKSALEQRHDRATRNGRSKRLLRCHLPSRKRPLERRSRSLRVRGWIRKINAPASLCTRSTYFQSLPRSINNFHAGSTTYAELTSLSDSPSLR